MSGGDLNHKEAPMATPRVILVSGKGGVGKTTFASATGVACAARGLRTLVMSIDIAHSLSDLFALPSHLLDIHGGDPVPVCPNLHIQEVDLQTEIERHWGDIFASLRSMLRSSGMHDVLSEELAILPGMSDVVCLLYINKYLNENVYDVIILDSAPTGESLRFISMPSTIEWSMQKLYALKKNVPSIASPLLRIMGMPGGGSGVEIEQARKVYESLGMTRNLLVDDKVTSVRLVCNAERVTMNETLRAYMYFCLYGMNVDMVAVNRLLPPEANNGYFDQLIEEQGRILESVGGYFQPARIVKAQLRRSEAQGLESLESLAKEIYGDDPPEAIYCAENPYQFISDGEDRVLTIKLPGAGKEHVKLYHDKDILVVRAGNFKRHVYLPAAFVGRNPKVASYTDGCLSIRFDRAERESA
jgi:arsenite-transporting ATPase